MNKFSTHKPMGKKRDGSSQKASFIDLFAGIGGIRIGFEKAGFSCVFSSEFNEACAETYRNNFGEEPAGDITKINESDVSNHNILCAGFPCQSFSIAGEKKGFEDTRGTLFYDILRIAKEKKPEVIFLENVKNLKYHDKKRTLNTILKHLGELGYILSWKILNAKDFGCPQNRERIIIIGSKKGQFDFDKVERRSQIKMEDILEKNSRKFSYLDPTEYTLIKSDQMKTQKSGLKFVGYRNKKIRTNGVRPNTEHLSRVHKQCNRIYSSEGVSPTISSTEIAGRYFILHDGKVRKLSINECFRAMGFPDNFKKISTAADLYRQVGNSVCVPMMEALAKEIKRQLF